MSDKATWVQSLKPLGEKGQREMTRLYQRQVATLKAVDRSIGEIVSTLEQDGRLDDTWLIFLSDNGFSFGEHRYGPRKSCGYEVCVRVPMIVAPPPALGIAARSDSRLVLNIDVAPTIAEITGIRPDRLMDGQSLVSMMQDPQAPWRTSAGLELWANHDGTSLHGVVTPEWKYIQYFNGERELYNLTNDPDEMNSLITNPGYAAVAVELHQEMERVMTVDPARLRYLDELLPCLEVTVCSATRDDDLSETADD